MPYVPKWERLSDAVARIMNATGMSKEAAQADICCAIADGAIKIRIKPERRQIDSFHTSNVYDGKDFQIPNKIKTENLNWERSCPIQPWPVQRGIGLPPGHWYIEWIELFVSDVTRELCSTGSQSDAGGHASGTVGTTVTSAPALESSGVGSDAGPQRAAVDQSRRRGARPKKFEQARNAMRNDIQQGRLTVSKLHDMLEKELSARYSISRDTARKARNAVLLEFDGN